MQRMPGISHQDRRGSVCIMSLASARGRRCCTSTGRGCACCTSGSAKAGSRHRGETRRGRSGRCRQASLRCFWRAARSSGSGSCRRPRFVPRTCDHMQSGLGHRRYRTKKKECRFCENGVPFSMRLWSLAGVRSGSRVEARLEQMSRDVIPRSHIDHT